METKRSKTKAEENKDDQDKEITERGKQKGTRQRNK